MRMHVDLRESILDISGQEIMTADIVSLRLNGLCTFRVRDPIVAVNSVDDYRQALYREAQLVLGQLLEQLNSITCLATKMFWPAGSSRRLVFG